MSLKYRRSILFDQFSGTTTQQLQLEKIIRTYKEKLNFNSLCTLNSEVSLPSSRSIASSSRASSRPSMASCQTIQNLTANQARSFQNLAKKVKSVSLHKILKNFDQQRQMNEQREEFEDFHNPESRLQLSTRGKHYRFFQRNRKDGKLQQSIKKNLMQYFQRKPEEEAEMQSLLYRKKVCSELSTKGGSLRLRSNISRK